MSNVITFGAPPPTVEPANTLPATVATRMTPTLHGAPTEDSCEVFGSAAPIGFECTHSGLYATSGDDDPVFVCSPLRVTSIFRNENGTGWGRVVSVQNPDGIWHDLPILERDMGGSATPILAALNDLGLRIASGRKAKDQVMRAIGDWSPEGRQISVEQLGWANKDCLAFVLPSGQVIGNQDFLPMPGVLSHNSALSHTAGSKHDWATHIGAKCRGNTLMILAVSVALSGPLIEFLGLDMGTGVHFRGNSSCGKTTLLRLANSVWGGPSLISQWRTTSNGLEGIAVARNSMLLCLDELAEISGPHLTEAVYMLANGKAKARMGKQGKTEPAQHWRLAVVSSGELSIAEKIAEGGKTPMAGHEMRLIDIEADARAHGAFDVIHVAENAAAFADEIKMQTGKHYGTIGPAFAEWLMNHRHKILPKGNVFLNGFVSRLKNKLGPLLDAQSERVLKRFGVAALAGELATIAGLTGWNKGDAFAAATDAFDNWFNARFSPRMDTEHTYLTPLRAFVAANKNAISELGTGGTGGTGVLGDAGDSVGWRDAIYVYLTRESWQTMFPGIAGTEAAHALIDIGVMLKGDGKHTARRAPSSVPGRPRVFTIRADKLQTAA